MKNIIVAAALALLALSPARAAGTTDEFPAGRFACERPEGARVESSSADTVVHVRYEPRVGLEYSVSAYGWLNGLFRGGPRDAHAYVESLVHWSMPGMVVSAPPTATVFQGYPAWDLAIRYDVHRRDPDAEPVHLEETYRVVQRRWGYVVVSFKDRASLAPDDAPGFARFLAGVRLLPEPPATPVVIAILFVAAGVVLGIFLYQQKKSRARV